MITLVCTKCSTVLNVDDGFAGGVCRCSACGTIQTVPKKGEAPAKSNAPGTVIYERASREAVSKDLEALGEVVTSSGIVGSGMLHHSARRKRPAPSASTWIGIGAASLLSIVAVWFLFLRQPRESADPTEPKPAARNGVAAAIPKAPSGPHFASIPLDRAGTIVYLLDRGDATRPFTAPLQTVVLKSISTLQQGRRFQIRFWSANGESPAFPLTPGEPSDYNRNKAASWMAEIIGGQSTDAVASLDAALAVKPSEIVLVTGKAWQMDESFTNQAVVKLSGNPVRVHVVSLGTIIGDDPLARLASKTGGTYLALSSAELQQVAE